MVLTLNLTPDQHQDDTRAMILNSRNSLTWVRWMLVLPASILFPILIDWLVRSIFDTYLDTGIETIVARCVIMLLSTIGSLLLTYVIAPSNKFRTSTIIVALWILFLTAGLIIVIARIEIYGEEQTIIDGGASGISMLIGLTIGLLMAKKLERRSRSPSINLTEPISAIRGLEGMTVNERLHVSKLDKQFYEALKKDHVEARRILTLVGVDSASIEVILRQSL